MVNRVVQWTTGNVGTESVKAIVANPDLELVGCFAWSEAKVGVDVGELAGVDPIGIVASNDVDALLALRPDCVVYNPMWPSVGTGISPGYAELVAITVAGICNRVDKVTVAETADTTFYDSPDTERVAGFGHQIDHPGLHDMARSGTAVFGEAVAMVADALGVELDEII